MKPRIYRVDVFTNGIDIFCQEDEGDTTSPSTRAKRALLTMVNVMQGQQQFGWEDLYKRKLTTTGWSMDLQRVIGEVGNDRGRRLGELVQLTWHVSAPRDQYRGMPDSLRFAKVVAAFLELREADAIAVLNPYPANADADGWRIVPEEKSQCPHCRTLNLGPRVCSACGYDLER